MKLHQNINNFTTPKPVLKWAGGKQQMLEVIVPQIPKNFNKYIEPFFGGGAVFFSILPKKSVIADLNPELINLYKIISSDVESLITCLQTYKVDEETFYQVRSQNRMKLSLVEQAARTIYLNRTCFNGLFRVNKKGQFNVPYGYYKNPTICAFDNLRAVSEILQNTIIIEADYKEILAKFAEPGDFIFLDPPYLPISSYSDFKRYTKEQFYEEDHVELASEVERLRDLGCHVILTNSNHPLVHELYSDYSISVHQTRRNINSKGSKRSGEDVVVKAEPAKQISIAPSIINLPEQMGKFPPTRYMGSKQNLLKNIWAVASQFEFETVLDLFNGSGAVSYMFKTQQKQIISNDYMAFSACFSEALIENNSVLLNKDDLDILVYDMKPINTFVSDKFQGLYYTDEDNLFIDLIRTNIPRIKNKHKKALAYSALVRACMKKRPRGIFTYTGFKYDDGRRDLSLTLKDQFFEAVEILNNAVFDNGKANKVRHGDAMTCRSGADLVYIDPPYYSPHSDNEYVRRYHFVEGLVRDWKGVEIQEHTKTKKFKSYPTPFSSLKGTHEAFDLLFEKHRNSILIVSYSSNSLPTHDEMLSLMLKHKKKVEVVTLNHRYSFGNQGHKVGDNNNVVKEYLFIGY